ncbi:MAG TPA: Wzz/FepE/Etk N-terminal domain-containing protein [Thermoguttaceae bacterium]|nr:Wzz/FepE/Etk N-terminal domain-containing protein [Thermoguttaceae bacterium]
MHASESHEITFSDITRTLWKHRARGAITAIVVVCAAAAYAVFMPPTWDSSQAIVVREDATRYLGAGTGGRSEQNAKNVQQTLQEMVHSRSLLRKALDRVGPPATANSLDPWPDDQAVAALNDAVTLTPPKGTELGASDVFYLRVRDKDRERSLRLTEAVYAELQKAFGELRATLAQSEIDELKKCAELSEANLAQATGRLSQIEKGAGVDLVALRMLHQSPTGDTHIYRELTGALDELRQTKATQSQNVAMLDMLKKAEKNPLVMAAAPKELLDCHPSLARLIRGLAESRLRTFAESSRLTEEHCDLKALRREEEAIREGIRQEVASAIEGVSAAQELTSVRYATLESLVDGLNQRLARLTEVRAEYSNLVSQVEYRRNLVEESQRNLAEARAAYSTATASSVLSRMDFAEGGLRPVSPSRAMIGLGGLFLGIVGGAGMVFLTAPIARREKRLSPESAADFTPVRRASRNGRRGIRARRPEPVAAGDNNH